MYFFPNNYLKLNHIPLLRGVRKKKYKKYKITSWCLFKKIEEVIDDTLTKQCTSNEFFNKFVDFKEDALWAKANQDTIQTNLKTDWAAPVYTLNRMEHPVGVSMDGMW